MEQSLKLFLLYQSAGSLASPAL